MAAEEPRGFPRPSMTGCVAMSPPHRTLEATTTDDDDEPLWTQYMSDCITVATYNHETKVRSLCHLPGGQYESLVPQLVDIIDGDTVVIFTNGTSCSKDWLRTMEKNIREDVQKRHDDSGKEGGIYRVYYTDPNQDTSKGLVAGTFVIQPDGRYGRIQAEQSQAQGQTSSRGLQVEGGRGSGGKERRGKRKRGFWRKMFCCCFK